MRSTNKTTKLFLPLVVVLALTAGHLRAQKTDISIRAFPSSWYNSYFEPALDGFGLCYTYHPILNKVYRLNISGEFSVLRARNELLLGFGINKTFWQAEHFRISLEANLLNGIDLYKPYPLYVGGIEGVARFDYYVKKGLSLYIGIGARYTLCPGYRTYGVWRHNSWPLMLGIRF
jgi:hypothetical protein